MDQIVDYLSDYAAALSFNDLPAEVVHHVVRCTTPLWGGTVWCKS
jgi:hypothetical protein